MNDEEKAVLDKLVSAWNAFLGLSQIHPDDTAEFRHAVHQAQNIILARPTLRTMQHEIKARFEESDK